MKISEKGLALIKEFEGLYLEAYKCPAGVWTIGFGTTEPINGQPIQAGMKITKEMAETLLLNNLKTYEAGVNNAVKVKLNQNQYDALVSFAYNCGVGALQKSDLLKYLNQGEYGKASDEFPRWNKANGKVLNGLVRRRKAEQELFNEAIGLDAYVINSIEAVKEKGIITSADYWIKKAELDNDISCLFVKLACQL